ncbi:tetratricopeptide repeat protein [Alteromonas sp. W364]|uniref:tetratricopeptide repeat protein n=1 Tax=Alteromonas sp. W364 TaxID=3075610 RepID=UPI0028878D3B|nr:tetratricopeptide repeat protein [Alteromonas sp. W364]MDT0629926.1 tetratricopeptide repeat protein [Alteromonas sp. W364]
MLKTLNNKRLLQSLLVLSFGVMMSACSSLPSLPTFGSDEQSATEAEQKTEEVLNDGTEPAAQVMSEEELAEQALMLEAQGLMASINAYQVENQSQKKLNSSQLQDIQNAMNALAAGNTDGALSEVQRVLDDPDFFAAPHTSVWVLRGDIHQRATNIEQAIKDYEVAIALSANNYQALNRLGKLHRDMGNFEQAKEYYNQALKAWPGNASTYRNRGILNDLYIGDKASALSDYRLYKALLDIQVQSTDTPAKALLKEQRLAGQWITDIKRQLKAIAREQANG